MKRIVLFEDHGWVGLLPLVYWRSVFELLAGRINLLDRIVQQVGQHPHGLWTRDWMADVAAHRCQLPVNGPIDASTVLINGRWLPRRPIKLKGAPFVGTSGGSVLYVACDRELAHRLTPQVMLDPSSLRDAIEGVPGNEIDAILVDHPWDLISRNADTLADDWSTADVSVDGTVSSSAFLLKPDHIHIGERTVVRPAAAIDAESGPVFISYNVVIEPHTYIAGPVYIGPGTTVKAHSSIGGGTTIGPVCRVGGEIAGSIISGYSSKEHEGYLGHSFLGNWVDIGPGTANTDRKNTYGPIRVLFGPHSVDTGLSSFGAIIADHARVGTNQKIPNGGVIGFAASTATGRFLPKFVHSFAWVTDSGLSTGDPTRLLTTARLAMQARHVDLTPDEATLFNNLTRITREYEQ
jgi:UDP-N-acetylglucosamine diphosphorylase/glucosamine-1-phosphate N-acetyltransferase